MAEPLAITTEQACRLTTLSKRQLSYWDKTEFFSPGRSDGASKYFGRLYTFRDIVGLRAIARLRDRISLQELRRVGAWLSERHATPWSSLRFYILGKKVYFKDPRTGAVQKAGPSAASQTVIEVALEEIEADVRKRVEAFQNRSKLVGRVERHRTVLHNAPVIAGTRIMTATIWDFHEAGYSTSQIRKQYPRLTDTDIDAALKFERKRRSKRAA